MPSVTRPATLECAGNGRIFLIPQVKGAQWQLVAVSTAEGTGVLLSVLLERAGLDPNACEVLLEAADRGTPNEEPIPPGATSYARSIAIGKAKDSLIAYKMNGDELPLDHGFPLRAVVSGHYGMASVKWLTHIRVVTEPSKDCWQTSDYGYWAYDENDNPMRLALGQMAVKSAIARPRTGGHPSRIVLSWLRSRLGEVLRILKRWSSRQMMAGRGSLFASSMSRNLACGDVGSLSGTYRKRRERIY